MADWSASMQQTYEFYIVDKSTWKDSKKLDNVITCTIDRDSEAETLGSAVIDVTESLGECYIRAYLVLIQNGITEKHALGTFLVQTPRSSFDGKIRTVSMDAYTPLLELKEKQPPIGHYLPKGADVMEHAYMEVRENIKLEARVVKPIIPSTKLTHDFVANTEDTELSFVSDLITAAYTTTCYKVVRQNGEYTRTIETLENMSGVEVNGVKTTTNETVFVGTVDGSEVYYCIVENITKYKLDLDEMGRILFVPEQDTASLCPVWTYTDDNSSILYSDLTMDHDLYMIPNVVTVIYSDGKVCYESTIENNNPNSPISIVSRGRRVVHRVVNPELYGTVTQERVDEYAKQLLRDLSSVEYTITYTHGYCPVRVNDCVRFNYSRAGLTNVKAKVIRQSIKCEAGCPVTETAIFTTNLWG